MFLDSSKPSWADQVEEEGDEGTRPQRSLHVFKQSFIKLHSLHVTKRYESILYRHINPLLIVKITVSERDV